MIQTLESQPLYPASPVPPSGNHRLLLMVVPSPSASLLSLVLPLCGLHMVWHSSHLLGTVRNKLSLQWKCHFLICWPYHISNFLLMPYILNKGDSDNSFGHFAVKRIRRMGKLEGNMGSTHYSIFAYGW